MALCPRCRKRVAKRTCPALGSRLCNLCCGLLREKEVHCPSSCVSLARHKPYQQKRVMERAPSRPSRSGPAEDDVLKDERLAWLVLQLEAPVAMIAGRSPALTDGSVLLALEYAREKMAKGRGLLVIPGESRKPGNEIGEAVFSASERARWEAPILLASGLESYRTDEKLRCLDRIILSVRLLAKGNPDGRVYVQDLAGRFARLSSLPQKSRIIQ